MPYGGWWAIPPVAGDGWMVVGDSAGFLNSPRLKGIHLAIKSGMLAAETAFEALIKDDFSAAMLGAFQKKVESSWIKEELWKVRNFHQGFRTVASGGACSTPASSNSPEGAAYAIATPSTAGHQHMKKLASSPLTAEPKPTSWARLKAMAN